MGKGILWLLPVFAAIGLLILLLPNLRTEASLIASAGTIGTYAWFVWARVKNLKNRDSALHGLETIYFLGFLNTLMALTVLFVRLGNGEISFETFAAITPVFSYIGIAVVTSLTGLLLQNLTQAAYLERHPISENQELKEAAEILQSITEKFSDSYLQAFRSIQEFLDERKNNTLALDAKEKQYIAGIDRFIHGIDTFNQVLESSSQKVTPVMNRWIDSMDEQGDVLKSITESASQMQDTAKSISNAMNSLPFDSFNGEMEKMSRELQELGHVIDGIVEILDKKLKKVKV